MFPPISDNHLDAVYDVTIAYPYNFPQTEPQLLAGNVPKEVHFHVERHAIDTVPENEQDLQKWCQKCWENKERRLCQFYQDKKFCVEPTSKGDYKPPSHRVKPEVMLWIALVYWTIFVIGIFAILCYSSLARWLAMAQVVFFIYMGHKYGGFEIFQADYFNWFFNRKKKEI